MILIASSQTKKVQTSPATAIWEFPMDERAVSGAVAEIKGRYPEKGFAINEVCKELAFVVSGGGHVVTPSEKQPIHVGDLIFLNKGESFAWEGNLTLFMATTPKFDSKQHVITGNNE